LARPEIYQVKRAGKLATVRKKVLQTAQMFPAREMFGELKLLASEKR